MRHLSNLKAPLSALKVPIRATLRCGAPDWRFAMRELPSGHIEIRRDDHLYRLWLTPDIHRLLRLYAQQTDISITDAGNRILLGFLTQAYGFENPAELVKGP